MWWAALNLPGLHLQTLALDYCFPALTCQSTKQTEGQGNLISSDSWHHLNLACLNTTEGLETTYSLTPLKREAPPFSTANCSVSGVGGLM